MNKYKNLQGYGFNAEENASPSKVNSITYTNAAGETVNLNYTFTSGKIKFTLPGADVVVDMEYTTAN